MMSKRFSNVIEKMILICSGIVLAYLLLVSILSTCSLGSSLHNGKRIFYRPDYPILHLAVVFVLMAFICWVKKKAPVCKNYDKAVWLIVGIWGAAAALWVLCFMEAPKNDPGSVLLAAMQMRQYNFSSFVGDGYLNIWTGNSSLALFFYLLSFLFGYNNYIPLRLLNVIAVMVIFLLIYKMVGTLWGKGKRIAFWSVVLCACFIPAFLYTTFVYGDIYGLCLAVMAVYAQLKYFRGGV